MSQIINEDILWDAAEKLRDKVDPADYKNVVLGLVFLKYVSDKFTVKYNELKTYGDGREEDDDYYIAEHVFIVPEKALWNEIAKHSKSDDLGQVIEKLKSKIQVLKSSKDTTSEPLKPLFTTDAEYAEFTSSTF